MASPVQAAWVTRHRLEEIDPPHAPVNRSRLSRVNRTLQLSRFDQPYPKTDTTLSTLLTRQRLGIDEGHCCIKAKGVLDAETKQVSNAPRGAQDL